VSEVKVVYH